MVVAEVRGGGGDRRAALLALSVFEILPINRPKRADVLTARLHQLSADAEPRAVAIRAEIAAQIPRIEQAIAEHRDRLMETDIREELGRLEEHLSVRQFIDRASRIVRELSLRAANHRMAEGIALHRFHETFPGARARERQLLLIAGPTNSGKTYAAFQQLAAAKSGVYLAPLRLMAAEFWDRMRAAGVPCSLITGEERFPDPDARHISSTIEMLATDAEYDVAIIDEVQMIADQGPRLGLDAGDRGRECEARDLRRLAGCGERAARDRRASRRIFRGAAHRAAHPAGGGRRTARVGPESRRTARPSSRSRGAMCSRGSRRSALPSARRSMARSLRRCGARRRGVSLRARRASCRPPTPSAWGSISR